MIPEIKINSFGLKKFKSYICNINLRKIIFQKYMKTKFLLFLIILIAPNLVEAQGNRWKRFRYEAVLGIGATNFLGELGGANQIGTDYYKDLEIKLTRPAVNLGMRYKLTPQTSLKVGLTWGAVAGDDALTKEQFRSERSIHFRSHVIELAAQYELYLKKEQQGHRFKLKGVKGRKAQGIYPYAFIGISGFWFNPRAKDENGDWTALKKLGTEGQYIAETRSPYSRFQVAIPYGIGVKYRVSRQMLIGLEYGVRKTFTDYLDDTSRTYWPNGAIKSKMGETAAYLADPTKGTWNGAAPNDQRGDPTDKDSYLFLLLNVNYVLQTTRSGLPKFR